MSLFSAMNISASGMTAQRLRMDIVSQNIANVGTTRGKNGEGYTRQLVVMQEKAPTSFSKTLQSAMHKDCPGGVKVTQIIKDEESEFTKKYDPGHPDADSDGYVTYSNVNTVSEMTDLIDASRAYEANVTAFNAAKSMALAGLEVGK